MFSDAETPADEDHFSAYHAPRPLPWRSKWFLSVNSRKCDFRVFRLAPVDRMASIMVTRPCRRANASLLVIIGSCSVIAPICTHVWAVHIELAPIAWPAGVGVERR